MGNKKITKLWRDPQDMKFHKLYFPKYKCDIHGDIGDHAISFGFMDELKLDRMFCAKCFIEKLDELGVSEAKKKGANDETSLS